MSRKRRCWVTQQKSRSEQTGTEKSIRTNVGETIVGILRKRDESNLISPVSDGELFIRTEGQLLFTWCLPGVTLEDLTSCEKLKLGKKDPNVYRMLMQYVARDDIELSFAMRKEMDNATCFLRWIMSVLTDVVIQVCYRKLSKNRALESRVSSVILNVHQNAGIEKDEDNRQSLENHAKIDEIRRLSSKKFDSSHDVQRAMIGEEEYSKPTKRRENQYVSGVMGMSYNPFLSTEAGAAFMNFEVTELLKLWTEKIFEIDTTERK